MLQILGVAGFHTDSTFPICLKPNLSRAVDKQGGMAKFSEVPDWQLDRSRGCGNDPGGTPKA